MRNLRKKTTFWADDTLMDDALSSFAEPPTDEEMTTSLKHIFGAY